MEMTCKDGSCGGHKGGCSWNMIAKVLLIIGGLNWGLVGVGMFMGSDWNIVGMIFGTSMTASVIYILVGVAAVMKIFGCKCRKCMGNCGHDDVKAPTAPMGGMQ